MAGSDPHVVDIYVHVPKTGGSSLRRLVIAYYGARRTFVSDGRADGLRRARKRHSAMTDPRHPWLDKLGCHVPTALMHRLIETREGAFSVSLEEALALGRAVIGHIPIDAFDGVPGAEYARYFTVLREPLARMISQYRYAQGRRRLAHQLRGWEAQQKPLLPFVDFALDESVRNYQVSFTGRDSARYTLLGTTEYLRTFVRGVGLLTGRCDVPHDNRTSWRENPDSFLLDRGFVKAFKQYHDQDYGLYQDAANQMRNLF